MKTAGIGQRLTALENALRLGSPDPAARQRLTAKLDALAGRLAPVAPVQARATFEAALARGGDSPGIVALRRAVAR